MDVNFQLTVIVYCAILLYAGSCSSFSGLLDIDEINNVNYGIDIMKEPVLFKPEEELPVNHIHLTSKFGQRYRCYFPNQIETERKTEEKEKEALQTGIPELLKPLESGPCLLKAKDWWSYEFCYGKYIRQFHVEDGKIVGDIIYLGYFESEEDWSEKEESDNKLNRYHTQTYVNGSKCDLTGQQRKIEVRFICDEGAGDHIGRIDEPETCSYVMLIHTNKICHHPYLKPIKQSQAVPITCNPILTEEQFDEYQQMVQEEKERKLKQEEEEERQREEERIKKEEEKNLYYERDSEDHIEEKLSDFDENDLENNGDWKPGTGENYQNKLKDAELKVKVQVINNMEDLEKVFKDLKKIESSGEKLLSDDDEKDQEEISKDTENSQTVGSDSHTADDGKTTFKFETVKPKDKIKSLLTEVVKEMEQKDDKITQIDNTQTDKHVNKESPDKPGNDEEEVEGEEDLIKEFDKGLEDEEYLVLKSKLQKNKETLSDLQSKVRNAVEKELDNIIDEAEKEVGVEMEDRKKSYKHLTESLENLIKRLDSTQEEIDKVDKHLEEATGELSMERDKTEPDIQGPDKDSDDRVKVRVTRVNRKDLQKSEDSKQSSEIENVEMQLKDELEKAGLDLAGGKVQVKIITAGYYDKKGDPIKTLSAEDSDAFKNMIVSILGGDHEAAQEANKYEEQEENYSFVWKSKEKKMT